LTIAVSTDRRVVGLTHSTVRDAPWLEAETTGVVAGGTMETVVNVTASVGKFRRVQRAGSP